jgi:serine-type D-Ala-D-Ala carboxypeptidase/endopeptidase
MNRQRAIGIALLALVAFGIIFMSVGGRTVKSANQPAQSLWRVQFSLPMTNSSTNGFQTSAPSAQVTTDVQTEDIKAFLQTHFADSGAGMVVGLVDGQGTQLFAAGRLDNGTDAEVAGNTVFEIGSITKVFTALLLLDLVQRGEMKLDEPVVKYLPASIKVPTHAGKNITLLNLAAQDSGLPFNANGLSGDDWNARYDAFTVQDMYAFLAGFSLTTDPGTQFQYSNLGMSLLGHALERKSGTNFEALVVERICRPLHMDDTRITLTPEMQSRFATGHTDDGKRAPLYHLQALAPAGAFRSTANDLLKFISANLQFTPSSLAPLFKEMQTIRHRDSPDMGKTALPWYDQAVYNPPGTELLGHAGGTPGGNSFVGFDLQQRRGVVVLTNQKRIHSSSVG